MKMTLKKSKKKTISGIKKTYNFNTVDKPSIDEIMLFYVKGEK